MSINQTKTKTEDDLMEMLLSKTGILLTELLNEQKLTNKLLKKIYNPE